MWWPRYEKAIFHSEMGFVDSDSSFFVDSDISPPRSSLKVMAVLKLVVASALHLCYMRFKAVKKA